MLLEALINRDYWALNCNLNHLHIVTKYKNLNFLQFLILGDYNPASCMGVQ